MTKRVLLLSLYGVFFGLTGSIKSFAQYNGGFSDLFFYRQPSARAEAMGKGYTAIGGDIYSVFYNPAGLGKAKGININATYIPPPFYLLPDAKYYFSGVSYSINKDWVIGFSNYYFSHGELGFGFPTIYYFEPITTNYTATISYQPIKNLFIGVNTNYLKSKFWDTISAEAIYFDMGILKTFEIKSNEIWSHKIDVGLSIVDINYAKMIFNKTKYRNAPLPVILRAGASYSLSMANKIIIPKLNTLDMLFHVEYQNLLNYKYYTAVRVGSELTLLEVISLRAGYYIENSEDYGYPDYNKNLIADFTYGFGIQFPIEKLSDNKVPININFDFISIPQVSYIKVKDDWENFRIFNIKLNWKIGKE